ncbi:MAG: nucleotidyltransferase family protein [candidate division Zixibacteria bacterium]|nr:nucleotidyltransferase family protein [candidate division Zixibacteria bacterium]
MQAVILAGGMAKRLGPLTKDLPKSMLEIKGRPFLEYQLELLKENGITEILLCLGHLSDRIKSHFSDGSNFGVRLTYSTEPEKLLGTGGALRNAYELLQDEFLVTYGDSYLDFSYKDFIGQFRRGDSRALMAVYKNLNRWDKSNVVLQDDRVVVYDKKISQAGMDYIDAGALILAKEVVNQIPENQFHDLESVLKTLVSRRQLRAFRLQSRFYEIGSAQGLEEFSQLIESKLSYT